MPLNGGAKSSIQGLAFFFGLLFVGEVALILIFGVDYRFVEARYIGPSLHLGFVDLPLRMLIPFVVSLLMLAVLQLFLGRTFIGRAILAVSQDRLALQLMAADPSRIKRFAFGLSIATASVAGALLIIIQPVEPSIGRDYIGRIFAICVLGGMTSFPGMLAGADPDRRRRKPHRHLLRPLLGAGRGLRLSAADPGDPPRRHPRAVTMTTARFWIVSFLVAVAILLVSRGFFTNEYYFFAAYQVLQFIVLATAWNILGGYTGYTNFGVGAFFAGGAYTAVVLHKLTSLPVPVMMLAAGLVSGLIGFGMGYLTLRLKGVFFAIATLAMAIVAQTLITNWDFVGGSRGIYVIRPQHSPLYGSYIQYLYSLMLGLVWISVAIARTIEGSRLGLGFNAIRDDEQAAETAGVPTLRLKLIATTLSGGLMGMAGAPLPYYVTYLDPASSFNLSYAVNSVAMPLIGGMTSWVGPILGAVLLGTIQQLATVTISSALNLLIVGLLLIAFVIIAPNGIVGLVQARRRAKAR